MTEFIDRIAALMRDDDGFDCPLCGHTHEVNDCDVCTEVVSYWGDEPHDFTCFHCGQDFQVREHVTRKFTAFVGEEP